VESELVRMQAENDTLSAVAEHEQLLRSIEVPQAVPAYS
jgi:hypothetical protein